jgi:hypothetical protein
MLLQLLKGDSLQKMNANGKGPRRKYPETNAKPQTDYNSASTLSGLTTKIFFNMSNKFSDNYNQGQTEPN